MLIKIFSHTQSEFPFDFQKFIILSQLLLLDTMDCLLPQKSSISASSNFTCLMENVIKFSVTQDFDL